MGIGIEQCNNMALICSIMSDTDIWQRASDGIMQVDDYIPSNSDKEQWFTVIDRNELVGCIFIEQPNSFTLKIHPYLYKKQRYLCRELFHCLYRWIDKNTNEKRIFKLLVEFPVVFKSIYNCMIKVGFKLEGVNRKSTRLSNEAIVDQYIMGITRDELKEQLLNVQYY